MLHCAALTGKYGVTHFQYIGELCRYILAQPLTSMDGDNKIRWATGNGLRPEIWREFQERFQIEVRANNPPHLRATQRRDF